MKLSAPTKVVFAFSILIAILALLGTFVTIPYITAWGFWILLIAFVLLAAGNTMKGV